MKGSPLFWQKSLTRPTSEQLSEYLAWDRPDGLNPTIELSATHINQFIATEKSKFNPSNDFIVQLEGVHMVLFPIMLLQIENVVYLDLRNTNIREIPDEISNLTALQKLFLSENYIQKLPRSIGKLQRLTCLSLRDNNLQRIPPTLVYCKRLAVVKFHNNPALPSFFSEPEMFIFDGEENKKKRIAFDNEIIGRFTYRQARTTVVALLVLSKRKKLSFHKDVLRNVICTMLYETRDEECWFAASRK